MQSFYEKKIALAPGSPKLGSNLNLEHLGGLHLNFRAVSIPATGGGELDPLGLYQRRGEIDSCSASHTHIRGIDIGATL